MKMSETDYPFLVTKEYRRFTEFCDACKVTVQLSSEGWLDVL